MANNESYVLLDIRGMVLRGYNRGKDPEGILCESGESVNSANWGMAKFLEVFPLLETIPPRQMIAVWDAGNEYRKGLWPGYKAKRRERNKALPIEQKEQQNLLLQRVDQLLTGLGVTAISVPGVEADDIIAFLCQKMTTNNLTIYTSDQDLLQLAGIHPHVSVILSDEMIGESHKGTPLELTTLMKSIVGDSSDEYPGIHGMGPKAWDKLLDEYDTDGMLQLEGIIRRGNKAELEPIANDAGDPLLIKLLNSFEDWHLQYQVASLCPSLCEGVRDGKIVEIQWIKRVPSSAEVVDVLTSTGCMTRFDTLKQWTIGLGLADNTPEGGQALSHFRDHLGDGPIVAFDYESYDTLKHKPFQEANKQKRGNYVDVMSQAITGVSFCYGNNLQHSIYMPCRHKEEEDQGVNYDSKYVAWAVNLAEQGNTLVAQNAPFEVTLTLNDLKLPLTKTVHDTKIMAAYVAEDEPKGLKSLSKKWLNYFQASYEETLGDAEDMSQLTPKQVLSYGCDDSIVTAHLYDLFWLITTVEGTNKFLVEHEFEFIHEQVRGFMAGVRVDYDRLAKLDEKASVDYKEGMEAMTGRLSRNCTVYSMDSASNLYLDLLSFEQAKVDAGEISQEKLEEWKDNNWEKIYLSSKYIPYQEVREKITIKPTPKQLTVVALRLHFSQPITKVTKKFLMSEWIITATEEAAGDDGREKLIELITNVVNAKAWKKPESDEYIALMNFCSDTLNPEDSVTKIGDELNFDSPKQMQQLLYCKMGLPIRMRSKVSMGSMRDNLNLDGAPATDGKAVDMALAEDVDKSDWRYKALLGYVKAKTALTAKKLFYRPLPMWQHPLDGMVHPGFNNCGTVTRRPTGSSPNLLQITKKDGGELRSCFRPLNDDHVIVTADWSGEELRIMASESLDPALLDAYIGENKKDVHSVTASSIAPAFLRLQQWVEEHEVENLENTNQVSYEEFISYLYSDDETLAKAMKSIRGSAKACISEGSQVLTNRGLISIESVLASDKVWDGIEWVEHEGVIYNGEKEVIHYDGITATSDHEVFLEDGRKIQIGIAAYEQERPRLAIGETDGMPVRCESIDPTSILVGAYGSQVPCNQDEMHSLRSCSGNKRGEHSERVKQGLCVSENLDEVQGSEREVTCGQVQGDGPEMPEQEVEVLQELRREGDRAKIHGAEPFHKVDDEESSSPDIHRSSDRQREQRRSLRTGEHSTGNPATESVQQTNDSIYSIQRSEGGTTTLVAPDKNRPSRVPIPRRNHTQVTKERNGNRRNALVSETLPRRQRVYDIVNAGPRHRYTVSGKIVANCNFLIAYLGGYSTLARGLMIKTDLAKELMNQTFDRYQRIKPWQQETIEFARTHGYTQTAYGNRRHLGKGILSKDDSIRSRLERQGVNHTIQGCASDILKVTKAEITRRRLFARCHVSPIADIYDEVAASVPRTAVVDYCFELKEIMNLTPPGHQVPMVSEFSLSSDSWGKVKEIGAEFTADDINKALEQ